MSFELLNPWMLAGLAGVALPVIAHLLSKKKYDIVQWGAMQFLELRKETRRRVWLEDLWLLLLRMALIAWLAIALGRPWISAKWLGDIGPQPNRDVVLILDGSYSMAWEAISVTPQQAAVRWFEKFLDDLRPGDTVAVLEAREQVRPLIEPAIRDVARVREVLKDLAPPTGSANFPEALSHAVKLLSHGSHLRREIVLLTDGQLHGWFPDDAGLWLRVDDLAQQSSITPRVWAVNVLDANDEPAQPTERLNFHVERLQPSRELTVPSFPVRFQTKVRYSGGSSAVTRQVHFEVDGQRLAERSISVSLSPNGEANVEFEHRFDAIGSHLVRVTLDADDLPTDNSSEAVVRVTEAVPVLIVDGDPRSATNPGETFFLRSALNATGNDTPWIQPTVVKWDDWSPQIQQPREADPPRPANELDRFSVVVLANVPKLSDSQLEVLRDFVRRGGGLGVALGNRIEQDNYANGLLNSDKGLLAVSLTEIESEPEEHREDGVMIANATLESPWLQRFRAEHGAAFTMTRFSRWWKAQIAENIAAIGDNEQEMPDRHPAVVLSRLQTGAPYLVAGQFGRGQVMLLTSPLDADWNTLPAKPDYVAFVHELLFQLASRRTERNVRVGQPLISPLAADAEPEHFVFEAPDGKLHEPKLGGDEASRLLVLDDTTLPGVYVQRKREPTDAPNLEKAAPKPAKSPAVPVVFGPGRELFVVNADRAESDLTPLTDEQIGTLTENDRFQFVSEPRDTHVKSENELPRHELWQLLLLAFLALLVGEVLLTRRLVRGGHAVTNE